MVEKIMLDYLNDALTSPVYMERPTNPPREYVIIQKTGSSKVNRLETATLAFQSYSGSLYEASVLNEVVKRCRERSHAPGNQRRKTKQRLQLYEHGCEAIPLSGRV